MIRPQGKQMADMRPKVKFVSYSLSNNGHIRVELAFKQEANPRFYHWLNPAEEMRFKASEYWGKEEYTTHFYKNHR